MPPFHDTTAPRRPTNLSLNADLVAKARAAKLNLSAIAEAAIGQALAQAAAERFHAEIARSVAEYHRYLDTYGSFADAVRALDHDGEGE
jgi:antitoxin CcdA